MIDITATGGSPSTTWTAQTTTVEQLFRFVHEQLGEARTRMDTVLKAANLMHLVPNS